MQEDFQHKRLRERLFRRERRSVPAARVFAARALLEWDQLGRAEDVLLCVSELATNALLHGVPPGRGFRMRVGLTLDGCLTVEAHDSGGGQPHIPQLSDGDEAGAEAAARCESGRGLLLVRALADEWGVRDRCPGKVVWCVFDPPEPVRTPGPAGACGPAGAPGAVVPLRYVLPDPPGSGRRTPPVRHR
ncbi:ATP-binding protein [Streptomyces sp. 549]|uniref:ATP-binding protein n=1 Tax=Streptomyces sp. 549 TaxID=3049076 RepID=UPI0024C3373E|nr:ATP-binding protein [Streptomyces sp. 549]MDK1473846.1 ATP-binding protein [Streptomyces sp. 549]